MDLINQIIVSKATGSQGIITGVKSNGIHISFTNGLASVPIPFDRFDDLIVADEWISESVKKTGSIIANRRGDK